MNGGWISRNASVPSAGKRGRSYDDDWGTYEARGSGRSGRPSSRGNSFASPDNSSNYCDGRTSNRRPRETSRLDSSSELSRSNLNSTMVEGERASKKHSSRLRIPDHRGVAARVGSLSAVDCHTSSIPSLSCSDSRGVDGLSSSDQSRNNFLTPEFLKSAFDPPPASVKLPPELRSTLNDEQCLVVESILSGHSTFFTGPAGSGKSHVLSTLIKANELGIGGHNGEPRTIVVTATTGVAACNIGGTTIHAFAGVGSSSSSAAEMARRVLSNEYAKQRWREVDVLIIDEVSMMSKSFLDKICFLASRARNDRRPFGGVQLVVCGDFFQLPPIDLKGDGFAFEADCWPEVIKCSVLLRQVFRQRGDSTLMSILDEARIGELSAKSVEILKRHATLPPAAFNRNNSANDGEPKKIIPTLLECRNRQVDKANEREMAKLQGEIYTFHSRDRAISEAHKSQLKHCQAPAKLELKVGAQVILLKNIDLDKGLANGSRGVIVRFQPPKSEGDVPSGFKKMDLPVVRFDSIRVLGQICDDDEIQDDEKEFTILPEEWSNKQGDQVVSSRVQLPLRLAWALSVHKSQGMTISNLVVDLKGVFEYGQAYVALSRATELRLLTLRGFSEKAFRAHPKVKEFYRVLDQGPNSDETSADSAEILGIDDNVDADHLCDPFEIPHTRDVAYSKPLKKGIGNPYSAPNQFQNNPIDQAGPVNPYLQPPSSLISNFQTPTVNYGPGAIKENPVLATSTQHPSVNSPTSGRDVSPTFTTDQLNRMKENRLRALAIRMKKQRNSSHL